MIPLKLHTGQASDVSGAAVSVHLANAIDAAIKTASWDLNQVLCTVNKNGSSIAQGVTMGYSTFYTGKSLFDAHRTKGGAKWSYLLSAGFHMASSLAHMLSINMRKKSAAFGFSCFVVGLGLRQAANYMVKISSKRLESLYIILE